MVSTTNERRLNRLLDEDLRELMPAVSAREVIVNTDEIRGFNRVAIYDLFSLKHEKINGTNVEEIEELNQFYMQSGGLRPDEVEAADVTAGELLLGDNPDENLRYLCHVFRDANKDILASVYASINKESRMALIRFGVANTSVRGTGVMQELLRLAFQNMGEVSGIACEAVDRSRHFWERVRLDGVGIKRLYQLNEASGVLHQINYQIPDLHPDPTTGDNTDGPIPENLMLVMKGYKHEYPATVIRQVVGREFYDGWYEPREGSFSGDALQRRRQAVHKTRDKILSGIPADSTVYAISGVQQQMLEQNGFTFHGLDEGGDMRSPN